MSHTPPDPEGNRPAAGGNLGRRIFGVVAVACLAGAYASNLAELARTWRDEPDYSHGFLVPFVALMVAVRRLKGAPASSPWWPGLAILALVLGVRAYCFEVGEFWLETATLLPALGAVVLTLGGWPLFRRLWPAILFLGFMLTIPAAIDAPLSASLQRLASSVSGKILRFGGVWVMEEGNVLDLGEEKLEVATACNGLAMLMSFSATVAAIILLVPMSRWRQAALLLSTLPIAILCNILRIVGTAYCYETLGSEAGRKIAHDVAGWMMMPLALGLIGLQLAWFTWVFRPVDEAPPLRRGASA